MAALTPPKETPSLSQKQRRAAQRRERRKKKRQALAQIRDFEQTDCQEDGDVLGGEEEEEEVVDEAEEQRQRLHELWLEREQAAQEEFRIKKEREDAAKRKKEEEERRIKEEWEEEQRKERESKDQKQQQRRDREEAAQKMLDQAENELEKVGSWRNPEAPAHGDHGTEKDRANCPFFLKTGACRFGDRCSRKHEHPTSSTTLLVKGMFVHYGMEQCRRDDFDTDANLEFSEEEVHQQFRDFYEDALPEFKNVGTVVQFKVSCNFEPHLRGNVYVQYATEEDCGKAFVTFNGRWYAGRQLQCEFCPVTRWKTAICGLFDRQRCPKGKHCNFLHVFRNPTREFVRADQDLHLSPDRDGGFTGRFSERSWSQRSHHHTPTPDRRSSWRRSIRRSRSRDRDRRSKSRERRSRSHSRESRVRGRRSRSGSRESRTRGRRSRSGSRESRTRGRRSRSGSRESKRSFRDAYRRDSTQRFRRGSRSRSRERQRSRSREQNGGRRSREGSPPPTAPRSESRSKEEPAKKKSRKKDKNAKDKEDVADTDVADTPRRHKHSKKSKKKKGKKKHKRKSSKSPDSSSAESGKDTADEKDEKDDQSMAVQEDKNDDDQVQPTSVQEDVGDDHQDQSQNEDLNMCPASPKDAENANQPSILKEKDASMEALGETDTQTVPIVPDIQEKLIEEEVSEGLHDN